MAYINMFVLYLALSMMCYKNISKKINALQSCHIYGKAELPIIWNEGKTSEIFYNVIKGLKLRSKYRYRLQKQTPMLRFSKQGNLLFSIEITLNASWCFCLRFLIYRNLHKVPIHHLILTTNALKKKLPTSHMRK